MAECKLLFPRNAKTEPKNVRPSVIDIFDDPRFFLVAQVPAAVTDQFKLGIKRTDALGVTSSTVESVCQAKKPHAALLREAGGIVKEVRCGDPFRKRGPIKHARGKNQRHAVGMDEIRCKEHVPNR